MLTLFLFLLVLYEADGGTHSFKAFYTATTGISGFPEFTAIGAVDDVLTAYYDSFTKQAVPRTDWMRDSEGPDYWKRQTDIIVGTEQSFKNNIQVAMGRFNHSGGVHTVQRMYGCSWDDETKAIDGFNEYGYDGEDFLTLNLKELRYISPVPQALPTVQNWNNRAELEARKQYLSTICIEWLQKYLQYGKSNLDKKASPQVSLLQKDPSSPVMCHATGFYPSGITISWKKNAQDHDEDVDLGELLPNEDGTYQKTSTLKITPDELKKNQYSCVVEHQGKTIKEDKIRTNNGNSVAIGLIVGVVAAVVLLVISGVAGYLICKKKKDFKPVSGSDDGSNSSAHTDPNA